MTSAAHEVVGTPDNPRPPGFPPTREPRTHGINAKQYETLMKPLNATRISKRSQGGKELSYLESWDVRAHLIRIFGFGNFDEEVEEYHYVTSRDYMSNPQSGDPKPMVEVIYSARVRLNLRDERGTFIATYCEAAVGSASGPVSMLGEHHDNALKTAASDALKRCAINLGSQFGLSLYDKGGTREVVKGTIVQPPGVPPKEVSKAAEEAIATSLGGEKIAEEPGTDAPKTEEAIARSQEAAEPVVEEVPEGAPA